MQLGRDRLSCKHRNSEAPVLAFNTQLPLRSTSSCAHQHHNAQTAPTSKGADTPELEPPLGLPRLQFRWPPSPVTLCTHSLPCSPWPAVSALSVGAACSGEQTRCQCLCSQKCISFFLTCDRDKSDCLHCWCRLPSLLYSHSATASA